MGCSSCGGRAEAAATYPREVLLSDGSKVTVTSAADERVQRARAQQVAREQARRDGYTVSR